MADAVINNPMLNGPYDAPTRPWRYRDLAQRTRKGWAAAGPHVVFVGDDGSGQSDTRPP